MLGVTGFETSSNFVEEQAPGVFPKTLRNMWVGVSVFNPLLVLVALFVFSVDHIKDNQASLLADMADKVRAPPIACVCLKRQGFCRYLSGNIPGSLGRAIDSPRQKFGIVNAFIALQPARQGVPGPVDRHLIVRG
jgi:hypothetical protein